MTLVGIIMITYTKESIIAAHKCCIFHQTQIMQSTLCGCFHCMSTFSPDEIIEWTDQNNPLGPTAFCPKCAIDSVIGSSSGFPISDINFLRQMNQYWFKGRD